MKRHLPGTALSTPPGQQFTDEYLQEFLTGNWELIGIQLYDQQRQVWAWYPHFRPDTWCFGPDGNLWERSSGECKWFIWNGLAYIHRLYGHSGDVITERYGVEPVSPTECRLYDVCKGNVAAKSPKARYLLKRRGES